MARDRFGVGYFYGTFNESPNVVLLVGGTEDEFCEANPDDPFNGEPGVAPLPLFPRGDGSVDLKVNDKGQPINLYYSEFNDGPLWIEQVCSDYFSGIPALAPFASGTADLKVRISVVSENLVDIFNSVNGIAAGSDGTVYKVRAFADVSVEEMRQTEPDHTTRIPLIANIGGVDDSADFGWELEKWDEPFPRVGPGGNRGWVTLTEVGLGKFQQGGLGRFDGGGVYRPESRLLLVRRRFGIGG